MRVCHINLSRELRGGEQQTIALVRELASAGANRELQQVLVIRQNSDFHEHCKIFDGFELRAVPPSILRAALAARDADIVHVQEGRSTPVGALLSLFGIPYLITRRVPNRPKDFFLTRWVYSRAATIACVSDSVAKVMKNYSPTSSVTTVYDCIRPLNAKFDSTARQGSHELRIGVIGEIDFSHKGQDVLVPAAQILADRGTTVKFLVAGTGRDESRLRAMTAGLDSFEYQGWVDNIAAFIHELDVIVHPARKEGLGSVLLEAMSLGTPAIAAAVGGIPEIVKHEQNGLLVKSGSAQEIADAITRLAEDRQFLATLTHNARIFSEHFSARRMAEQYLDIYEQLVPSGSFVSPKN